MSTPIHAQVTGQFTSTGTVVNISLPSQYDKFEMYSTFPTDYDIDAARIIYSVGTSYMPAGFAQISTGAGAGLVSTPSFVNDNGFTFLADTGNQTPGAPVAITGINNANPAVVTASGVGLVANSSIVRITNSTGMLTIAGMDFTVGTLFGGPPVTSFQLKYLDSTIANLTGIPATAGFYRIIPYNPRFYPVRRYITNITQAASAVIKLSVTHGYTVGQQVRIYVPGPIAGIPNSGFGMTQMNAQMATITAIDLVNNTITVNINSTGYTAFSFPSSASIGGMGGGGTNFAFVEPFGEAATTNPPVANLLDDATRNVSITGVQIGSAVQTNGSTYQWIATKGVAVS